MESLHRQILQNNRVILAKDLDISEICQSLVGQRILSDRMVELIYSKPTGFDQNVAFLNKLPTRGPYAFDAFCLTLVETGQEHLAQLLSPDITLNDKDSLTTILPSPSQFSFAESTPIKPGCCSFSSSSQNTSQFFNIQSPNRSVLAEQNINNVKNSPCPIEHMDTSSFFQDNLNNLVPKKKGNPCSSLEVLQSHKSFEMLHSAAGILPSDHNTAKALNHISLKSYTGSHTQEAASIPAGMTDKITQLVCDSPTTDSVTVKHATPQFLNEHARDCYPMFKKCKGLALLVNVLNFEPSACLDDRLGSERDVARLELILRQLSYEVYPLNDGTANEIWNTLKNFAAWSRHGESDSCFVVLMSHGEDGIIYGRDGRTVCLEDVYGLFSNVNCPHLQNKPKVFLVQACRGDDPDKGTDQMDGPTVEKVKKRVKRPLAENDMKVKLPTMSDCIFAYATVPGYSAMRNTVQGSWFIQAFIQIVAFHAKDRSLDEILTMTNNQVKAREGSSPSSEFHRCKEMSVFTSCLCKPFYFFPGLYVDCNPEK